MARRLVPLFLLLALAAARAQDEDAPADEPRHDPAETRLRLETDGSGLLEKDLARMDELLAKKRWDDALVVAERLARDPRSRDVLVKAPANDALRWPGLASFDRAVRARLLAMPAEGRAAYDLRNDSDAARLEEISRHGGDLAGLSQLVARHPASSRAPRACLTLAERLLERGDVAAAAARFEEALRDHAARLEPAERDRALAGRAIALALSGQDEEVPAALAAVPAASRPAVAAATAARPAVEPGPGPGSDKVAWAHDVPDWYDAGLDEARQPFSEPAIDGARVYLHDGSRAVALSLETGKAIWRTALRPGASVYRPPADACRLALGPAVVACVLPLPSAVVALDRATGLLRWRATSVELAKAAKVEGTAFVIAPSIASFPGTFVVALLARSAEDELYLLGLDATTGALRWRTFIAGEQGDPTAPACLLASGPKAAFALTGRGLVAALDPDTGSVLWLRRHPSVRDTAAPRFRNPFGIPEEPRVALPSRPPFLGYVHGRLLAAPPDATRLYAFEPDTGALVFETDDAGGAPIGPCEGGLLELAEDGTVNLVGRKVTKLARHADAKLRGRPARWGKALFLPLDEGLVRLDLAGKDAPALLCRWSTALDGFVANVAVGGPRLVLASGRRALGLAAEAPPPAVASDDARACCTALGDPSFAAREAAQKRLLELGAAARGELDEAARSSDPEVRMRARALVDELGRRERLATWRPRIKAEWLAESPTLLDELVHPNPSVRLEAISEKLSAKRDDAARALLVDLLEDPDARVAGHAAIALLRRGDRVGLAKVVAILDSVDGEDRLAALAALAQHGKPEDLPIFEKAARDESPEVRKLGYSGAVTRVGDAALPLIAKAFDDEDASVRQQVAQAVLVARLDNDAVAPLLGKMVKDPEPAIRIMALEPLAKIPSREAVGALAGAIVDADPNVARKARLELKYVEDKSLIPREPLEKALDTPNQDENDRYHFLVIARKILEGGGGFRAGPLARTALEAQNPQLRDEALEAVSIAVDTAPVTTADVAAIGSLALRDDDNVRFKAFQILAKAKGEGRGLWLLRGLDDKHEQLRRYCRRAVAGMADRELLAELLQREALGTPDQQARAAELLSERPREKRPALVPVLIAALSDPREEVRAVAWRRLREASLEDVDLGFFEPGGDDATRAPAVRRAALWWWEHEHQGALPEGLRQDLGAATGAARFKAAKKLAALADEAFRSLVDERLLDALAQAAAKEDEEYVLRQELLTLSLLARRPDLALAEKASPEEKARIVRAAVEWRAKR